GRNLRSYRIDDRLEGQIVEVLLVLRMNRPVVRDDRRGDVRSAEVYTDSRTHSFYVWRTHRPHPHGGGIDRRMETIDLISLRNFSRRTGQPTHPELLDARPIQHVNKIEIDEEHVTVEFDEKTTRFYNVNEISKREWTYKYNDDPEFVKAVAKVSDLARKHLKDMPDNIACPPGCAECCSGYEPFVSRADVQ